ncbi:MAG: TetR/AcrR family transcriptional regulator, partial [Lentilactobacillus hilgardii]
PTVLTCRFPTFYGCLLQFGCKIMKSNLKVLRTEASIQNAFIKVCEKKGFTKMTINDIATTASISRGTFYLHYVDKFDMLKKYQTNLLCAVTDIFNNYPKPQTLETKEKYVGNQNAFYKLFDYLYSHRQLTNVLLQIPDSNIINRIKEIIANEIKANLTNKSRLNNNDIIPTDYAREIILQNILVIITFWLSKPSPEKPQAAFDIFLKSRTLSPIDLLNVAYQ